MPRINIEEGLWSDPRFLKLCVKVGDEMKAVGAVVVMWRLAQKFWCPNKKLIPLSEFEDAGLPMALIESKLAEQVGPFVRAKGIEERFNWWFECQKAGRMGGKGRAKGTLTEGKGTLGAGKGFQPSSSYSSSNTKKIILTTQKEQIRPIGDLISTALSGSSFPSGGGAA